MILRGNKKRFEWALRKTDFKKRSNSFPFGLTYVPFFANHANFPRVKIPLSAVRILIAI